MDHWGDPWSDNANDKSPTESKVTSPLPPAQPAAPVLLNGFLDDAGWGNDDNDFGDWATSSGNGATAATAVDAAPPITEAFESTGGPQDGAHWNWPEPSKPRISTDGDGGGNWSVETQSDAAGTDTVSSEASDSATTVHFDGDPAETAFGSSSNLQPGGGPAEAAFGLSSNLQADDDSSARPSTSPSETSHNDVPADSPRTSIDEERGVAKLATKEADTDERHVAEPSPDNTEVAASVEEAENRGSHIDRARPTGHATFEVLERIVPINDTYSGEDVQPAVQSVTGRKVSVLDALVLDELFPPSPKTGELLEAPEDPVYSTSARKAWYRLTRKQTLREFNSGAGDDNYIRVTWATSNIRTEVNQTVGRWAREDRLSGTGPGARASFYWDTPAPAHPVRPSKHLRTKTSATTPRSAAPMRQSLPPLSMNVPATFHWNSPTVSIDPWQQADPLPLVQTQAASDNSQEQEVRTVSTSIVVQPLEPHVPEQATNAARETPSVTNPISSPTSNALPTSSDPWASLSFNTDTPAKHVSESAPPEDDDDWGEMVGSPAVSAPNTPQTTSRTTFSSEATLPPPSTPPMIKRSPVQDHTADAMHTSHIVRLRGAISPTSAIFGGRNFLPLGTEQGPIGPGILKPVHRSVVAAIEQGRERSTSPAPLEKFVVKESPTAVVALSDSPHFETTLRAESLKLATPAAEQDDLPAIASSTSPHQPARQSTPPPPIQIQPEATTDPWADADFSFFESAIPPPVTVSTPPKPNHSEAFSAFVTPPRSTRATSKSFSRSPSRTSPSPPVQPLTGATNAAQRRKDEEELTIREILDRLPDLGYMLR